MSGTIEATLEERTSHRQTTFTFAQSSEVIIAGGCSMLIPENSKVDEDTTMDDSPEDITADQPRKRAAVGDGISAGSASREASGSPPPQRSKAQAPQSPMDADSRRQIPTSQRPKGHLWTPDQDSPSTRSSFDPSNIASIQENKTRAQAMKPSTRRLFKSSPQLVPRSAPHASQYNHYNSQSAAPPAVLHTRSTSNHESKSQGEEYTIILQPETRPISQEQLVAEVKGIYAGLVMVEAKCIEMDNKQAGLTQGDSSPPQEFNNEQWQALIALHRTLLHEHHDFFLASQGKIPNFKVGTAPGLNGVPPGHQQ
ncbi:hypothetical protein SS1G_08060 [Sclerotinia sclerotiorum 1980 UF-70]|uniref:Uncharacterized protein n=2 Tax=Sclerotinia sclerotiorum (strain ATCC 18683 / 1980 / Ss-1) TaxID=665079 RepID=A7ERV5_SCLS1|nr:hypothetical protein SS1G_08060 [Sclerotinia sclerotiorum 1980 UF-70]EDN92197.1 hypothetical protein SS1G_08060 [Sclerotinia sclerotiorum 1980 UF-70]